MQVGGRYKDTTDYGFMKNMGIWFENFALPVVVNECLMQSYTGTIRLFPNWPADQDAAFHSLRAVGCLPGQRRTEKRGGHPGGDPQRGGGPPEDHPAVGSRRIHHRPQGDRPDRKQPHRT